MPFDKSRHLCLQAFPTSILINGGSLSAPAPRHSARLTVTYSTLLTASGFNHAHSGTPTDTMESTEALCIRKNEKTQVQVAQKASPSHMWSTKMIFFFLFYVTVKRSSHAALLESHRLNPRIDTAVPRAVQGAETCARAQEPDSCYNESFHQAVRCHQISLRPRTVTSSREAEQCFTTGRKSSI